MNNKLGGIALEIDSLSQAGAVTKRIVSNPVDACAEGDASQAAAKAECGHADTGDAVADGGADQAGRKECPILKGDDVVRNVDAGQPRATVERVVADVGDAPAD